MKMILSADENWGIGKDNRLLASVPEDMKFFRETTSGHVVVMGRKTLESFPGGKPLKNRTNIVITTDREYDGKGAVVVNSFEELKKLLESYETDDVFIIGGGNVYRQMLPYADTCYITKFRKSFDADTFFPDLDKNPEWKLTQESETKTHEGMDYSFCTYKRISA